MSEPVNHIKFICVSLRSVYGNELIYPACDVAVNYIKLQGRKTFTASDVAAVKSLGIRVTLITANGIEYGTL